MARSIGFLPMSAFTFSPRAVKTFFTLSASGDSNMRRMRGISDLRSETKDVVGQELLQVGLGAGQVLVEAEEDRGGADARMGHDGQRVGRVGVAHRERAEDVVVRLEQAFAAEFLRDVHAGETAGDHVAHVSERDHVQFLDEAVIGEAVETAVPEFFREVFVELVEIRVEFGVGVQHFRREAPGVGVERLYEEIAVIVFLFRVERFAVIERRRALEGRFDVSVLENGCAKAGRTRRRR